MSHERYRVEAADEKNEKDWAKLTAESIQATPFIRKDYLKTVGCTSLNYMVYQNDRLYMGICIPVVESTGKPSGTVPFAPYQGLLYLHHGENYKDYHNNLEATEVLLEYLYEKEKLRSISFSNSYRVSDIRGVQWHHYHQPGLGMYDVNIRYASVLNLKGKDPEGCISPERKKEYTDSIKRYGFSFHTSDDVSGFMQLYEKNISARGQYLSSGCELETVRRLAVLLMDRQLGELCYVADPDGRCVNAAFILEEGKHGYYLFGANDPGHKACGWGLRFLLAEQIKRMQEKGIEDFDFLGADSLSTDGFPYRFGGEIYPYYVCEVNYT